MQEWTAVTAVATKQYGLASAAQLHDSQVTGRQIKKLVASGRLQPVRRGVYRVAGTSPTWMGAVLAAVLAAGDGAVASHQTAAFLWDLKHIERPETIHLAAPRQLRLEGVTSHATSVPRGYKTRYRRVPVAGVPLTIVQLAGVLGPQELGEAVDDALRRRILGLERLRRLVDAVDGPGRRRLWPLHRVLAERLPGYRVGGSDWEQERDGLWDHLGLPRGVRQHRVTVESGETYILDRALPDLMIGVEWDSYAFHTGRSALDHDSERRANLVAAGWTMIGFTPNSTPAHIARTVWSTVARLTPAEIDASGATIP